MWYKMPHHLNEESIWILLLIIQFIQSVKWGFRDLCWFQVSMAYFPHLQSQLLPPIYQLHHRFKKETRIEKAFPIRSSMFDGIEMGWTAPAQPFRNPPQVPLDELNQETWMKTMDYIFILSSRGIHNNWSASLLSFFLSFSSSLSTYLLRYCVSWRWQCDNFHTGIQYKTSPTIRLISTSFTSHS